MGHQSGILCHLTSLPSQKLSEGYRFVDWLRESGFSYWQMLPLTPPDKYRSPYASPSAFAGWGDLADPEQNISMKEDAYWLNDWALFCAIKKDQGGKPWYEWPEEFKNRNKKALDSIEVDESEQSHFMGRWNVIREYASSLKISLVGDLPIFCFT